MYLDEVESTPGSVSQVRSCSYDLIKLAKRKKTYLIYNNLTY